MKIELRGVRKRFGRQEALRGIDLTIPHGQRTGIVGPNGSGKSTLLRIVMGLVSCEGEVRIDGRSPFAERQTLAHRMAYVPQVAPHMGATVGEIVGAVTTIRGLGADRIHDAAERLGLDTRDLSGKSFRTLSGGMKHKVLLALALSSGASLLILDEPTASLDVDSRARFAALLEQRAADATVLLCSHRIEEVERQADRVVELAEGLVARDAAVAREGAREAQLAVEAGAIQ